MPNDVREDRSSGALRGSRDTIGMEGQDVRIGQSGNRQEHVSRGSYINYYDDLGISTTPENAGLIRTQEKDFQTSVDEQQGKITEANSQLQGQYNAGMKTINEVQSGIADTNTLISQSWNQTKASFVPVKVVNGNTIERTYYLPKSSVDTLASSKDLFTAYQKDGSLNVEVNGKGGHTIGEELHTSLSQTEKDVYNTWYINSAGKITQSANSASAVFDAQKQAAYDSLNTQYASESGKIAEAQSVIDSATAQRAAEWDQLRGDYTKKKATIAEIFGNLKVEEAKPNG